MITTLADEKHNFILRCEWNVIEPRSDDNASILLLKCIKQR